MSERHAKACTPTILQRGENSNGLGDMTQKKQFNGLIGGIEKREILLVDYDPRWPLEFQRHATIVQGALGPTVLRLEHIGSTSVPGLAAKPIIDMLLVVENSADETGYVPQLEAAGYELRVREPEFHEHRMLRTPERDMHLHVLSEGSTEIARYITFRDRLRTDEDDRRLYEQTKRALATREWRDMNDYADAKSEVVERIIAAAQAAGL
jgi:GrpB-like predicted nucleotidyltransferase (UPF0157 family)